MRIKSFLIVNGIILLSALIPCLGADQAPAGSPDPYSYESIGNKNYRGVTLNVLSHEKPVLGEPVELHARQFEKLTGAKINVYYVPYDKLYQELLLGLKHNKYDVVFYGSMWIADVLSYLEPIPKKMLESAEYRDVLPHYKSIAQWGDIPYQVPIDGDRHYLQYRKDLLDNPTYRAEYRKKTGRDLEVPRTWPELQEIARFFQGRRLANGRVISGIAEITVNNAMLASQFIKRAAPYAKHPDVKGGFYFDLETMEPLINTPGFVEALKDFVAAQDLYPPGGRNFTLPQVIRSFGNGEAVFSDSWDDPFVQAMERDSPVRNRVAAALSPGSRKVWNRRTRKWDTFPNINYAPYIAQGWTGAVPRSTAYKEAAFDFLGFYANQKNHKTDLLVGRFGMNPFRASDLNEQFWVERAGWDGAVANSYVETQRLTTESRNRVLDLRIYRGQEYVYLLSVGVYRALTGRESPQSALDTVAERWRQLTTRVGVEKQREAYRHIVHFEDGS